MISSRHRRISSLLWRSFHVCVRFHYPLSCWFVILAGVLWSNLLGLFVHSSLDSSLGRSVRSLFCVLASFTQWACIVFKQHVSADPQGDKQDVPFVRLSIHHCCWVPSLLLSICLVSFLSLSLNASSMRSNRPNLVSSFFSKSISSFHLWFPRWIYRRWIYRWCNPMEFHLSALCWFQFYFVFLCRSVGRLPLL